MSSFADLGLEARLCDALQRAGIDSPFPIQELTLVDALAGRDVCGKAPTGSGKTLAYGLAVIQKVERARPRAPRALILVPTRELAGQVATALMPYGQARQKWVTAFFGGAGMMRQIQDLRRGVEVAVATPGRLTDLVNRGECDLSDVEFLVIDEADRMAVGSSIA
jgi:superfamily II DNA/RNA helicase